MRPRARSQRLAVALCGAVLLAACGAVPSSAPTRAEVSVGSSSPVETVPAATAQASGRGATVAPKSGLVGAMLHGVTSRDEGLIAVGSADGSAAAWSSADGRTWQQADVPTNDGPARFRAIAAADTELLAFAGSDDQLSTVWTSTDATSWTPVDAVGIEGRINGVTFHDGQWFAVGDLTGGDRPAEGGEAISGVIYVSSDGRSWRVLSDELTGSEATVSDIAANDGLVVVAGFDTAGGVVWLDPAGRFERIADGFSAATIQTVAVTSDGYVALGRGIADPRPFVWTSTGGRRWQRTELDSDAFAQGDEIHDLTTTAAGLLVAVGASEEGGVVWTSTDGLTWARRP